MSRRRVPTSFSQCLVSPCNCLVQKINQGTDVLTHNWLPRLIILTSNHKIKIDMASWQSAFTPSTANTFFIISENADCIDCLYGERGCAKTWVL